MGCDAVIIEDEELVAFAMSMLLSDEGISVQEAHTGEEGVEVVRREHPTVVLLDVRLPGIDGWEVCRRIKGENGNAPAVVFVTAATQFEDRVRAHQVGGDAFLAKPFETVELVRTVKSFLERAQESR
ncbi:MAG: response regulator [Chitinivibrionales bacterium]|nr:response regulator [Chitinivibrionales bacterium]